MTTIDELENNLMVRNQPRTLSEMEQQKLGRHWEHTFAHLPPEYQFLHQWRVV
jgi:hypothetical protein